MKEKEAEKKQETLKKSEELAKIDRRKWYALSMPIEGVRFDAGFLAELDSDHDGRIRVDEVLAAADRLKGEKLDEFLRNYLTMDALYAPEEMAVFQMGVLRIDAKELTLCFHVADEEAHSALAAQSKCCLIYLKLTRPSEQAERLICAAVTAGRIRGLYVGRNGVFSDRDGKEWEATITKVVESQVSLAEAFWAPWRKLGEGVMGMVRKYLGDRQDKATKEVAAANGAAIASSVAAVGIGIGMIGAAAASLMAVISSMPAWKIAVGVVVIVLAVSLPSVIMAWLNLRKRDLGAILNASGWAVNRPMRFSMKLAKTFTRVSRW